MESDGTTWFINYVKTFSVQGELVMFLNLSSLLLNVQNKLQQKANETFLSRKPTIPRTPNPTVPTDLINENNIINWNSRDCGDNATKSKSVFA